jgi:transcriptional regulator of acetoin/glycerol metabolism
MGDTALVQHARGVLGLVNGLGAPPRAVIEETVKSSWQRCVNDYQLDPARSHSTCVVDSTNLKERQGQHDELVDIARAEMDTLYDQISGSGYALLLTDINGIILSEKIDPTLTTMFRSAGLIVGANWSEQTEGTNGIGTCIAEGRSITIHRADHFRARHIGLSCSGSPIRDPNGAMIAVLDASVVGSHDTRSSQMHTMALVNTSARLIEKCLFLRRCQPYRILRFHSRPEFVNLLHDAALALADDGTIVAADDMAVALLSVQGRGALVGSQVSDLFDVGEAELAQLASTRQTLFPARDIRLGRRFFISLVPAQRSAQLIEVHHGRRSTEMVHITPMTRPPVMSLSDLAGDDPDMLRNARTASRVVDSQVPILIQGPTGSGKEAFAKAMHLASTRAAKPFVAVNCGAIPESLIESELFGYRPGAFTGARKEGSRGYILQSSGGTLFLDEIGDMPLNLQTRLLRVLEEQEVTPLGSDTPIKVELRVVSASHRRLREMISAGAFREDLYYRLNGMTLELTALRDRRDKERVVRNMFASEAGHAVSIEAPAFTRLMSYTWPGNIRELRNVARTALAICEGGVIRMGDLPSELRFFNSTAMATVVVNERVTTSFVPAIPAPPVASETASSESPLLAAERTAILQAVEQCRWNMTLTARALGMSRNTLYRKLKRHDIAVGESRRDEVSRS